MFVAAAGSSPLARGSLRTRRGQRVSRRIIPARAGFTVGRLLPIREPSGSSPLARGSQVGFSGDALGVRIIPARAGFTPGTGRVPGGVPDHPRSRGVHLRSRSSETSRCGSSPLARGSPSRWSWPPTTGPDHPRSRGVHTRGSLESQRRVTLSDLVCIHCRPSARSTEFR